jgi:hypothetical protein
VQIDLGLVMANLVPMILVLIFTEDHLRVVWRLALGLGVIPPLSLFCLRLKLKEPEEFNRETMKNTRTPWRLVIKYVIFIPPAMFSTPGTNPCKILLVPPDGCVFNVVHI